MQDIITKRERYLTEAAECELIRDLATDPNKREVFGKLARDLRKMVMDLDAAIAIKGEALSGPSSEAS